MKKALSLVLALACLLLACPGMAQTAGTYTAEANGNNGPVKVEVVVSDNAIESVTVVSHNETPGICDLPIERIPADEKSFRFLMNEDAMATEKTAEGIRRFSADIRKLEAMLADMLAKA